jgi:hypothetical protein
MIFSIIKVQFRDHCVQNWLINCPPPVVGRALILQVGPACFCTLRSDLISLGINRGTMLAGRGEDTGRLSVT